MGIQSCKNLHRSCNFLKNYYFFWRFFMALLFKISYSPIEIIVKYFQPFKIDKNRYESYKGFKLGLDCGRAYGVKHIVLVKQGTIQSLFKFQLVNLEGFLLSSILTNKKIKKKFLKVWEDLFIYKFSKLGPLRQFSNRKPKNLLENLIVIATKKLQ